MVVLFTVMLLLSCCNYATVSYCIDAVRVVVVIVAVDSDVVVDYRCVAGVGCRLVVCCVYDGVGGCCC